MYIKQSLSQTGSLIPRLEVSFLDLQSHSQTSSLIPRPSVSFPDLQSLSQTSSLIPRPSVSFPDWKSHSQTSSLIPRPSVSFPDLQSLSQTFSLFPRLPVSFPDPLYSIALVACSTKGSFLLLYALPIFFHSLSLPSSLSFPFACSFLPQACPDTPIIVALNIFHERRVSALPIVNSEGGASLSLPVVLAMFAAVFLES